MLQALIFDVDGTLADTESAHLAAFNQAFATLKLGWHWDQQLYTRLLKVAGGHERIAHFWQMHEPATAKHQDTPACIAAIHALKTRFYTEALQQSHLPLRPGVLDLLEAAAQLGLPLALATTTTPANIEALLRPQLGSLWRRWFAAVGDGSTAPRKKPDPQVYQQVLAQLKLPASACLAIEDSEIGLRAARAAGLSTLVAPSAYTRGQDFSQAWWLHEADEGRPLPRLSELRQRFAQGGLALSV
ncbi:beta-phosphoglucomutase-like phosphatase (HAD superfamily) [Paucibacter oligotrophus]|uniref:Beta-phosphoglucomutase-like phosphatase (HAD superfamily) n=1 Tax=Roseateles oligotrophus TaxID=1769250 RepID=A0A840LAI5_9BURK|nr:HAD-IA family hydrolase [Roseateles oligotrophus]MBB4843775.1 beta-phosphoglucomutase-like phosphatase (HAD superfamily) [Roseateles oligotrophus]